MPSENQSPLAAVCASLMDADTRRSIIADPKKHAKEAGFDVEGKEVRVAACTKDTLYIPIDPVPEDGELSPEQLGGVSAAGARTEICLATAGTFLPYVPPGTQIGDTVPFDPNAPLTRAP